MFSELAPRYWDAGLPVIPLRERQKMPAPNAWQTYSTSLPSPETQAQWLASYPNGNIGLPLGPQSGMLALDLDTDDPKILRIIMGIAPPTPWVRRGKKGAVYMFRFNGERTTRIKGEDGSTIVEILSRGTQVVLPPSIHPDTQRPYEANAELLDVMHQLAPLPRDFETILRQALIDNGVKLQSRGSVQVTTFVAAGGRDSQMTGFAGLQARGVVKGERTLLEALNEVEARVLNYTENVAGDAMDPSKFRNKVMEFIKRDIINGKVLPEGWEVGLSDDDIVSSRTYFGEHIEEWSLEQYLDHLNTKFEEIPKTSQASRAAVVEEVLTRLAKSQHMTELEADMILGFISRGNFGMFTATAMRKRIKELKGSALVGNDHTEIAQALVKEIEPYGEIRFDGGQFFQWYGSHWRELPDTEILKVLAEEFGSLAAARRHSDHRGILQVLSNLVRKPLCVEVSQGVNFANGFLTTDLVLQEHDPRFGARYVLPYRYVPNEGAPLRFLGLLDQCWGENVDYAEQVQALREAIASTLFGMAYRFSRAICLFGPPKSGKSTVMTIVKGMVPPEAICSVPPHDWGDRFLPTQMLGKLLNFCGELSETEMIAGDRFKSIVEGEEMSGQFKGRDIFKFRPTCAHWFASNHLPRTRDTSDGFNRRWLFLHFTKRVSDDQKIIGLAEQILAEELEAIAAWAVPAVQDLYRQQEYTISHSHKSLISEVAQQNNSVRFFLMSDLVTVQPGSDGGKSGNHITEQQLYSLYYAFCKVDAHVPPVALKRFRGIMQELQSEMGFTSEKTGTDAVIYNYITPAKKVAA